MSQPLQPINTLCEVECPHCKQMHFVSVGILGPKVNYVTTKEDLSAIKQKAIDALKASPASDKEKEEAVKAMSQEGFIILPTELPEFLKAIEEHYGVKPKTDAAPTPKTE